MNCMKWHQRASIQCSQFLCHGRSALAIEEMKSLYEVIYGPEKLSPSPAAWRREYGIIVIAHEHMRTVLIILTRILSAVVRW